MPSGSDLLNCDMKMSSNIVPAKQRCGGVRLNLEDGQKSFRYMYTEAHSIAKVVGRNWQQLRASWIDIEAPFKVVDLRAYQEDAVVKFVKEILEALVIPTAISYLFAVFSTLSLPAAFNLCIKKTTCVCNINTPLPRSSYSAPRSVQQYSTCTLSVQRIPKHARPPRPSLPGPIVNLEMPILNFGWPWAGRPTT